MSCIAWNCRELGNLHTGRALVEIIWAKDPAMVFLAETLTDDARLEFVQSLDAMCADHGKWNFRSEVEFMDVKELLFWLIAEGKSLELFAYTAWLVWNQRNKTRLHLQAMSLHQVTICAQEMLAQYRENLQVPSVQAVTNGSGGTRWSCQLDGLVKINFDGAGFGASNMPGIDVVIWNSNGDVLASCSQKIPQVYKVEEIETLAAFKALSFAFELGFRSAILEGDSLGLIQALKSEECSLSPASLLFEDVKVLANNFILESLNL
nr:hypothetical protein CFP56_18945 [Quercus suber]